MTSARPDPDSMTPPSSSTPAASSWSSYGSIWRLHLHLKARTLRGLGVFAFRIHNNAAPAAAYPEEYFTVDATLGQYKAKGAIGVQVYLPDGYNNDINPDEAGDKNDANQVKAHARPAGQRIGVINVHGGGFVIGSSTDDTRWCRICSKDLDGAVVFSIEHRMAPEYPFPTPVEDVADAILAIIAKCPEYGIDPNLIFLTGFSAGGNLVVAAWTLLNSHATWSYGITAEQEHAVKGIKGMVLFYPVLDFTITRQEKSAPISTPLPKFLTDLFDQSYIYPPIPRSERTDTRLSPGLMSDGLLEKMPPVHLITCELDMLAAEARRFAGRLEKGNKKIVKRQVEGEKHGWDKPPGPPKQTALDEYALATRSLREFAGLPARDI